MKSFSTFTALAISICLLLVCQLEAGKPDKSDPHTVQLVMGGLVANCPVATSKGETIKEPLSGFSLDRGDSDIVTLDSGARIKVCCVTVHHKKGDVAGVTCFFGVQIDSEPAGIHHTDFLPASASVDAEGVWTIHVDADCVDVWKEKRPGKGTVAGQISIGAITYTPVP